MPLCSTSPVPLRSGTIGRGPTMHVRQRDENGSVAMVMIVMFVTSALIVTLLDVTLNSLSFSRRAGDSANALQLADAGINDAIRTLPNVTTSTYSSAAVSLGKGTYQYTATLDPNGPVWHVRSVGTDHKGVQRKAAADASGEILYGNAFFVFSALQLKQ